MRRYVEDRSGSLTGDLSYSGITNVELRLRAGFNMAPTEFGEKQADARAELRARYFFWSAAGGVPRTRERPHDANQTRVPIRMVCS